MTGCVGSGPICCDRKGLADEFNCLSCYSDAKPEMCEELDFLAAPDHQMIAALKTPSIRSVAVRPSYIHASQIPDLSAVVRHYVKAPNSSAVHTELTPANLTEDEIQDVVSLLKALSGPILRHP